MLISIKTHITCDFPGPYPPPLDPHMPITCIPVYIYYGNFSKGRPLECVTENQFSYFSTKRYVVGTQKIGSFEQPKHMLKLMG